MKKEETNLGAELLNDVVENEISAIDAADELALHDENVDIIDNSSGEYNKRLAEQVQQLEKMGIDPRTMKRFKGVPFVRTEPKIGRNDKCVCGSGKKYKKCCLNNPK